MDRFKEELNIKISKVVKCQKENNINSCLSCEKWEKCSIRKEYVESVYQSMSKGQNGEFDF